ncbi:MAG TPA: hypothetical protein VMK13_12655 [Streptosporangiaceae bacterium]|nr:hypothetical protein [Streptosporangiaceae bacterium]
MSAWQAAAVAEIRRIDDLMADLALRRRALAVRLRDSMTASAAGRTS